MTPAEQVKESIATLQSQLLSSHPQLPVLLSQIHKQLKADPELVTILSEEECGIIVSGLKKQTATEISTTALKKAGKKSLKSITLSDL